MTLWLVGFVFLVFIGAFAMLIWEDYQDVITKWFDRAAENARETFESMGRFL